MPNPQAALRTHPSNTCTAYNPQAALTTCTTITRRTLAAFKLNSISHEAYMIIAVLKLRLIAAPPSPSLGVSQARSTIFNQLLGYNQ